MTHPGWGDWEIIGSTGEASASLQEKRARAARRHRRKLRRRFLRVARWSVLAVAAFVLVVCGLVALDIRGVQQDLERAARGSATLQDAVLAGDTDSIDATVAAVRDDAGAAARTTSRPHWAVAGALPWVGPNVSAVRTMSGVVDDLAQGALPNLAAIVAVVDPSSLAPTDGAIDLGPLTEAADEVVAADTTVQAAAQRLNEIDQDSLVPFVGDAVGQVSVQLEELSAQTRTASRAVQLIPPMLGAEGPREYLLLVQNNAEPRATGGISGVVLQLRAEDGAIEIVDQRPALSLGEFTEPVAELSEAEVALFGTQLGRFMQNVTSTPDFPRSAELAGAMWETRTGVAVDGVMSVDPVALQAVLEATGSVEVDGVELTSENAAQALLNGIYLDRPNPEEQDAFFAEAAAEIFGELTSGRGDAGATLRALDESAVDGRLMVWSAHQEEQQLLTGTVLSGEVRGHHQDRPIVGVYLNDGSAAKIGYYLQVETELESTQCRPDGSQELTLAVTVTSQAPADAASSLPEYVTGADYGFVEPGSMNLNVLIYAPTGGVIDAVAASDGAPGVLSQVHEGLAVGARSVTLAPGESLELEVQLLSGPGSSGDPMLRLTPGSNPVEAVATASSCA